MTNLIRQWNGRTIRQRADGYLSATDMCQACNKLFGNWKQLESTKEYLEALHNKHYCDNNNGIAVLQFIESNVGGKPKTTGTWVHRKVALRLAQWLSPEFAILVDEWVEELLLMGKVSLVDKTIPAPLQLPPSHIQVTNLVNSLKDVGFDLNNPRFNQGLQDIIGNILGLYSPAPLGLNASSEAWIGVAERAEELGYPVLKVAAKRSQLGKYIKSTGVRS